MSPAKKEKKEVKEIADLPYYKAEHAEVLKSIGIETLDQLYDALNDEEKYDEIIGGKMLKGVGEKHAEHWMELIEDSRGEGTEAPAEEAEAPKEEVEIVEQPAEEKAKKVKVEAKPEEGKEPETEIVEPGAEVVPEKGYIPQPKPELDAKTKELLAKRAEIGSRRPEFKRQEWFRFQRLGETWRKPRGIHSKMRRHYGYRPPIVSIGYRGPKDVRDYHPSGFREVRVHTVAELDAVDPKKEAVRVGGTVGYKKRVAIEKRADELGIRILNRTG
jgi:large subunit ribosomal protein L32e